MSVTELTSHEVRSELKEEASKNTAREERLMGSRHALDKPQGGKGGETHSVSWL